MMQGLYTLEYFPGKGDGAVATSAIKHGTIIEREKPLVKIPAPATMLGDQLAGDSKNFQKINLQVSKIVWGSSKDVRCQFFALENSYPDMCVLGIVKTNGFFLEDKIGVFSKCSKFNHSCNPNCDYLWNEAEDIHIIRVVKDVLPGQELTISYAHGDDLFHSPRAPRQEVIFRKFNFDCVCEVCLLSGNALSTSEERRRILSGVKAMLSEENYIGTNPALYLGLCRLILTLLAEEGIPFGREMAYFHAFLASVVHGDLLRASAFVAKFLAQAKLLKRGDDYLKLENEYLKFVENPDKHKLANKTSAWGDSKKTEHSPGTVEFEKWLWERAAWVER